MSFTGLNRMSTQLSDHELPPDLRRLEAKAIYIFARLRPNSVNLSYYILSARAP
jgi:hypothetical protein